MPSAAGVDLVHGARSSNPGVGVPGTRWRFLAPHLRQIVAEFLIHYHLERNHQGLDNQLLTPLPANSNAGGSIQCRERLGGILKYYYREAA